MLKSLRLKFLVLLLGVAVVALSGTIILRELMLSDFAAYLEGESENKAYWIQAALEGAYERNGGWKIDAQAEDVLWALTLGFEMRLLNQQGEMIVDTEHAIRNASPSVKRRLSALSEFRVSSGTGEFAPYPLFLGGKQIGTLELHPLQPTDSALFVRRTDLFLALSVLAVGGLAILISVLFSLRLTRPVKELSQAASAISRGDLKRRVTISRQDELGELASTFNRMAQDLEIQESLRRKLIADVAHELRTPLGVMRGELEGMMDGLIQTDEQRLQSLYDETGRLKHLVDGIEELNQAEASSLTLRPQRIALKPLLDNIIERLRGRFEGKGLTLELACSDTEELYADPQKMSQIVLNLLSNALKATENGGQVTVAVASGKAELRIVVEDSGCGISEKDLPFIFERFYHAAGEGLGIGLTIVKELVEAQGGRIEAKSAVNRGSAFTIIFPARLHNSS